MRSVLLLIACLFVVSCGVGGSFETRTAELEMEVMELRVQLAAVNQQLNRLEADLARMEELEARLAAVTSERDQLRARLGVIAYTPPSP